MKNLLPRQVTFYKHLLSFHAAVPWVLMLLWLVPGYTVASGAATTAAKDQQIIQFIRDAEENFRGTRSEVTMKMEVYTAKWKRTYEMHSYEMDRSTSMTRILQPKKDRGTSFLKRDGKLWMYAPNVRKTIPIPGAMMGNSFMGSDFSYDDISRESDVLEDFKIRWLRDEKCPGAENSTCAVAELIPTEASTVAYGKEIAWIDTNNGTYHQVEYFDEDMVAVKRMKFSDIREIDGKKVAFLMSMENLDEPERRTVVQTLSAEFNNKRPARAFSKAALKEFRP